MTTYIVEKRKSSNAGILKINQDSTYEIIAYSAGENNLDNILTMVKAANFIDITDQFIKDDRKKFLSEIIELLINEDVNAYKIMVRLNQILEEI